MQQPASSGRPGPGEIRISAFDDWRLLQRVASGDLVADRAHRRAKPFQRLDDVEREAVVIVDHEDVAAHRTVSPAMAESTADAFRRVSSASAFGSES